MTSNAPDTTRPRLAISACLLGENVRYDGAHKRDAFLVDTLGKSVEWVPVCPEVECGLPVPREEMWLVGDPPSPRLVTRETGVDHTERMTAWVERRLAELESEDLDGYVFKSKSPSCGLTDVEILDTTGAVKSTATGIWARAFLARFPLLPVEDEARLRDVTVREDFIERVFRVHRR